MRCVLLWSFGFLHFGSRWISFWSVKTPDITDVLTHNECIDGIGAKDRSEFQYQRE
jgi:hypothetical protein